MAENEIESPPKGRSQPDVTITEHLGASTESIEFSKRIIKTLQAQDLIAKGNPQKIKIMNTEFAFYSDKIIFIKDAEGCKRVGKVFKKIEEYEIEKNFFLKETSYVHMVKSLQQNSKMKLPLLIEYKGAIDFEERGMILLTRAKGKTLRSICEGMPTLSSQRIGEIFSNVGNQLGALDALLYKRYKETLLHPDLNLDNLLLDKNNQLSLIDLVGIKMSWIPPCLITKCKFVDELRIDCIYIKQYDPSTQSFHHPVVTSFLEKCEQEEAIETINFLKKRLLALQSLYTGYATALRTQNLRRAGKLLQFEYNNYTNDLLYIDFKDNCHMINEVLLRNGWEPIDFSEYTLELGPWAETYRRLPKGTKKNNKRDRLAERSCYERSN
jgi:hypothetical protein